MTQLLVEKKVVIVESLRQRDKKVGGVTPDAVQAKGGDPCRGGASCEEPLDREKHPCLTTLAPFPSEMI
jgi:hypothetical protein